MTQKLKVNEPQLQTALAHLKAGRLVAMPTETVYGLAADAHDGEAVAKIFAAKGRPQFNPLICHVSTIEMAKRYGKFDILSERLVDVFWPGPLTLVLPKTPDCPAHDLVTANLKTIGLRAPEGIAAQLIAQFERALAAPSANSSGKISPTCAEHVLEDLGKKIDYVLDAGACAVGLESTIVKIDHNRVKILRAGAITQKMIANALGLSLNDIEMPPKATQSQNSESKNGAHQKIEAPGMLLSHYAPNAQMRINVDDIKEGEAALLFGENPPQNLEKAKAQLNLSPKGDLIEAASNLYAHMKFLDKSNAKIIAVQPIPNHGLGLAINDRLQRAAAPRNNAIEGSDG